MPRFTFDLPLDDPRPPPVAGDLLATARRLYRVTSSRPVDSKVWGNRWALTLDTIGTIPDPAVWERATTTMADGAACWHSSRYEPGETPQDYYGASWPPPSAPTG